MNDISPIHNALISVSDKSGIVEFAQFLVAHDVRIFSTGGTASLLMKHGIKVIEVAEYTGFPEMMEGRIKTLHPKVHGGLLGRDCDADVMREHGIERIDLVVVNLYPFETVIDQEQVTYDEGIENIDIGGPAMIRAAAKNHARVTVIVSVQDYQPVQQAMREHQGIPGALRAELAVKAFARTASYDATISSWLAKKDSELPDLLGFAYRDLSLRYGENPHQQGAFYRYAHSPPYLNKVQGKALSFNNLLDVESAVACLNEFSVPACVIVKHASPCGVACAQDIKLAYQRAFDADSISAFGGIIALNRPLDSELAAMIIRQQFVEVIVAPAVDDKSLAVLKDKPAVRILSGDFIPQGMDIRTAMGGLLVQQKDVLRITRDDLLIKTARKPDDDEIRDLLFAWRVVKHVRSNAIVLADRETTLGIGGGQPSRVASVKIAVAKACEHNNTDGFVMASDAFFPFRDGIDEACQAGVRCVIQPGGSIHDDEIIAAADEHGIVMVFTGIRHFRH